MASKQGKAILDCLAKTKMNLPDGIELSLCSFTCVGQHANQAIQRIHVASFSCTDLALRLCPAVVEHRIVLHRSPALLVASCSAQHAQHSMLSTVRQQVWSWSIKVGDRLYWNTVCLHAASENVHGRKQESSHAFSCLIPCTCTVAAHKREQGAVQPVASLVFAPAAHWTVWRWDCVLARAQPSRHSGSCACTSDRS